MQLLIKVFLTLSLLKLINSENTWPIYPNPIRIPKDHKCSPLYWYPRPLPSECYDGDVPTGPFPPLPPVPLPLPPPFPVPVPMGIPIVPTAPMLPVAPMPPWQAYLHMLPGPGLRHPKNAGDFPKNAPNILPPIAPYPAPVYPQFNPFSGFAPGSLAAVKPDAMTPEVNPFSDLLKHVKDRKTRKKLTEMLSELKQSQT